MPRPRRGRVAFEGFKSQMLAAYTILPELTGIGSVSLFWIEYDGYQIA
jgi:hypothetical protein